MFWKQSSYQDKDEVDENGKPVTKKSLIARQYTVFNLEQCEDVRIPKGRPMPTEAPGGAAEDADAVELAESMFMSYAEREGITVREGGARAAYSPPCDSIHLPKRETFETGEDWASTALHEATHSTGHKSRLDRKGITEFDGFGSHQYADEELVAEFGASFLCAIAGVERDASVENSAAYIAHWRKRCVEDPKLLVYAAQRAQKAADYIIGEQAEGEEAS